jgi:hypothetical protein
VIGDVANEAREPPIQEAGGPAVQIHERPDQRHDLILRRESTFILATVGSFEIQPVTTFYLTIIESTRTGRALEITRGLANGEDPVLASDLDGIPWFRAHRW